MTMRGLMTVGRNYFDFEDEQDLEKAKAELLQNLRAARSRIENYRDRPKEESHEI